MSERTPDELIADLRDWEVDSDSLRGLLDDAADQLEQLREFRLVRPIVIEALEAYARQLGVLQAHLEEAS